MEFQEATDRLIGLGLKIPEIAEALSYEPQSVRAMRTGARKPPDPEKWRGKLAALARGRAEALQAFASDAERG
jgi:hypothetical protein